MKTMGLLISHKNHEKRRALIPADLSIIQHISQLYFEEGYGQAIGFTDEEYLSAGANIVSRDEALACDIIVDVKLGDANYLDRLSGEKILVGWAHAVQNVDFTEHMLLKNHTVIAWEEMVDHGRYLFYRNREIAGEAAIIHAYLFLGKMPYDTKVAILGNGQSAKGAMRILHSLGATVDVYGRHLENLFIKKMNEYDVLVNCIKWDTNRLDKIIYKEDLKTLKPGTMIVDVSCDPYLEIETSHPTTIDDPVYVVDGVIHYCVDNTPALFSHTVSKILSEGFAPLVDELLNETYSPMVQQALVIDHGKIQDEDIRTFREYRGLLVK
ncbi:MAG: N(5)-(carboxyethyl)ornithine synthase [Clostridiaceae bacterium]